MDGMKGVLLIGDEWGPGVGGLVTRKEDAREVLAHWRRGGNEESTDGDNDDDDDDDDDGI